MRDKLTRNDWLFILVCALVAGGSLFVVFRWFSSAFPEASIDFRYDRKSSAPIAERLLRAQHVDVSRLKHTTVFDDDDAAKILLERSLGLGKANALMKRDVHLWYWQHRWFRPLQEEEYRVDVAPTGELVTYVRHIPEARAIPSGSVDAARAIAEEFLRIAGVNFSDLQLVAQSERTLPKRVQRIFTWDSRSLHPAGAPYRFTVTIDGDVVTNYSQRVQVPDAWRRGYAELRSKNFLASNVDTIFFAITIVAAVVIFIVRLLRGDLQLRLLAGVGLVAVVLTAGVAINNFPSELANYDTTSSWSAFLVRFALLNVALGAVGVAMFLIVIVGAGESMYRERLPQHLALSRIWSRRALESRRIFRAFVLAYTLTAAFLAYQVAFYLIATRFGAWSPAEVPYDSILNSAVPWIAVLFAGFLPGVSEEFMSRAFSIPFFERVLRSRVAAIVISGFIWGFGHAAYPNQPFFIRGVEVGLAGVILGFLMYRFGILPLVMWHFTIDALYTALLLFRSGNRYYVISAAISSLVFAIPMIASIALYLKNRGFAPDDDLLNASVGTAPEIVQPPRTEEVELPPADVVTSRRLIACAVAIVLAAIVIINQPPSVDEAIDYQQQRNEAVAQATKHLRATTRQPLPERVASTEQNGFRSWNEKSGRQDGGAPSPFDTIAADYLVHHGVSIERLTRIMRTQIYAGNWLVRFFTPLQKREVFVEIDPREHRVIGFTEFRDETAPGPRLEQPAATAIATRAMLDNGFDIRDFELKEALSFQQPNRRDWLLHFQDRHPLAPDAYRRVTVRIMGADVAQLVTTIKVPDAAYREANTTTLINTILSLIRLAGAVAIIALIVAGFVIVSRRAGFPWRRALRWTLILSIVPIAGALADPDSIAFGYQTSIQWWTFLSNEITDGVRTLGLQLGALFLALVAIDAIVPYMASLGTRETRSRLGRGAVVRALTAIATFTAVRLVLRLIAQRFPSMLSIHAPDISSAVAIPLPALFELGEAILRAVQLSAALALFIVAVRSFKRPAVTAAVSMLALFCSALDSSAEPHQMPLMLASAITVAILGYVIVRWILRDNVLAYPIAIFIAMTLQNASSMIRNHRFDLQANAVAELVAIVIVIAFFAWPREPRRA
jgi:membrane protease YdiL (CAAX protease family)